MTGFTAIADQLLLSLVIFVPLGAALGLMLVEGLARMFASVQLTEQMWKGAGLATGVAGFGLTLEVWRRFDPTAGGMQLELHAPWIPGLGIHYYVGVDGVSLFLVVLAGFLLPVVMLAGWNEIGARVKQYVFFVLALQTGVLGAFLSLNLLLFYLFYELVLLPLGFVIGMWGGPRRIQATVKLLVCSMAGSLLMLVGIVVLAFLHHQQTAVLTFDYASYRGAAAVIETVVPAAGAPWWGTQAAMFAVFVLAFAVRVPLFPLHAWLPDAQVQAPNAGGALLAGVLLELGAYALLRYALPLFPVAATGVFAPWIMALALVGIVYGALVAMVQSDVKRLLAYASLSQLGLVVLGMFALNLQGLEGSLLLMLSHGLSMAALFLLVGMIQERRQTREIADFGGLAHVMPVFSTLFVIALLSSIGLPALAGFVGEILILVGVFGPHPGWAAAAASGMVLLAACMLWLVRRMFFGPLVHEVNQKLADLSLRERVVAMALLIPLFWIGLHPASFLRPMDRSVEDLLRLMIARGADIELAEAVRPPRSGSGE